jgi:uncharacterized protein YcbK (DUF882 family)
MLSTPISRRQFLSATALTVTALALPAMSWATVPTHSLSFYHTHTGESLDIAYGSPGLYDKKALERINYFLRDFRTGEVHPIDPKLLNILSTVRENFGGQGTIEVISGYRSPKTNQQLRSKSSKVAKRSLHMDGKAIDIRITGLQTRKIQQCVIGMQCGGVGLYTKSDFVHLDTGRVRTW